VSENGRKRWVCLLWEVPACCTHFSCLGLFAFGEAGPNLKDACGVSLCFRVCLSSFLPSFLSVWTWDPSIAFPSRASFFLCARFHIKPVTCTHSKIPPSCICLLPAHMNTHGAFQQVPLPGACTCTYDKRERERGGGAPEERERERERERDSL